MSLFNLQYHIFFNSFSYDLHTYLKVVFDPIESYKSMNWQSWWFLVLIRNYRNRARSSYVHAQRLSDYIISYSVVLSRIMANRACSCHEHDIISYFEVLLARVPNFARVKATTSTDVSQCGNYGISALAQFLRALARACQTKTIPLCFVSRSHTTEVLRVRVRLELSHFVLYYLEIWLIHARQNLMSLCDRPEI